MTQHPYIPGRPSQRKGAGGNPLARHRWAITGAACVLVVAMLIMWWRHSKDVGGTNAKGERSGPVASPSVVDQPTGKVVGQNPLVDDPFSEGWVSERFAEMASDQLHHLADLFVPQKPGNEISLNDLLSEKFRCSNLLPTDCKAAYTDSVVEVIRSAPLSDAPVNKSPDDKRAGAIGLRIAIGQLTGQLVESANRRVKFKLYQVELSEGTVVSRQYFSLSGQTLSGRIEQNATWRIEWDWPSVKQSPRLRRIVVEQFEQVSTRAGKQPWLVDCAASVLRDTPAYRDRLSLSIRDWQRRIERHWNVFHFAFQGLSVADVNGDGLDDLYLCQTGGVPNSLFVQQPDGTVRDVASKSAVDYLDNTRSALLVDLDNDGDQDLVLALVKSVLLLENGGGGNFTLRRSLDAAHVYSMAAADYDNNGLLDLYLGSYSGTGQDAAELPVPAPYFNANNGGANRLFRNDGDWKYRDVTDLTGLRDNNHRFTFAVTWEDYDNDGDQDLYVVNDFGVNNLYRNENGRFSDVADEVGLVDGAFGMSASFGDYDRDGRMDIYLGNMFSSAGSRITRQEKFKPNLSDDMRRRFQRLARGNSLFRGGIGGRFEEVSESSGVALGRWSWGSLWADLNNDGWLDILVGNGYVTGASTQDL